MAEETAGGGDGAVKDDDDDDDDTSLGLHEFHRSVTRRLVVHEHAETRWRWVGGMEIRGALVLMTAAVREGVDNAPRF